MLAKCLLNPLVVKSFVRCESFFDPPLGTLLSHVEKIPQ